MTEYSQKLATVGLMVLGVDTELDTKKIKKIRKKLKKTDNPGRRTRLANELFDLCQKELQQGDLSKML